MTYFNRGGGFSGGRDNNSRSSFGGRGFDKPDMFHATCAECGKDCEVPFRPNGSKPVFCSNCFEAMGNGRSDRGGDRGQSKNFDRANDYVRKEYGNRDDRLSNPTPAANYRDEFLAMNRKLDRILELLAVKNTVKVKEAKEETAKEEITKRIKKAIKEKVEA